VKAPVTLSGCGAFVVYGGFASIPNSPAFNPSIPAKTGTVPVINAGLQQVSGSQHRVLTHARATGLDLALLIDKQQAV